MDVTDQFPSEENLRPENWLFRAVCQCAKHDKLAAIVKKWDETGKYEAILTLNGIELDATKFFDFVREQWHKSIEERARELVQEKFAELDDVFEDIKEALVEKLKIELPREDDY